MESKNESRARQTFLFNLSTKGKLKSQGPQKCHCQRQQRISPPHTKTRSFGDRLRIKSQRIYSPQLSPGKREEAQNAVSQIGIAVMLAALLLFAATFARAASVDETLAKRKPEASIDLTTKDATQLVKGEWRYSDTKIVEIDFKAPGPDGQPGSTSNKAYDFRPHATVSTIMPITLTPAMPAMSRRSQGN